MADPQGSPSVVPASQGRRLHVLGNEVIVKLSSADTGGAYFLFDVLVAPGGGVPPHTHSHEDEILHVMEGALEVFLGGKTFPAAADAAAFFPRGVVHGFSNVSPSPARCRFLVSPGASFERFLTELSEMPPTQPPDLAKIAELFERYGLPLAPATTAP